MKNIKAALVHDWLTGQRGGEKVLEVLAEIFPEAPIYTLFHFPGSQVETIEKRRIITSFLQRMPRARKKYRSYLPLFPLAVELFDLQGYNLVISSSHCIAKGAIPRPDGLHISYIHSPMRYAWNHYFSYFSSARLGFFSRLAIPPVIHYLRLWDESSSERVDHFVANSRHVAFRIRRYYRRQAEVIHPPVDTDFFTPGERQEDYCLIVSALVPYKRIEVAIEAFNQAGLRLKIVGQGPEYRRLKSRAKGNIQFLGAVEAKNLLGLYQQALTLVIPGEEDFGINSLEAQACGIPVIALERGGARETVIPGETGLFFSRLDPAGLLEALDKFKGMTFNKHTLRANALNFSRARFKEKISSFIHEKWSDHQSRQ